MVTITNTTVTREQVWVAFRRMSDGESALTASCR
jgi:hypothetical protein